MVKKSKIGGYKFEKLTQISNGLIIPTGNDTRPKEIETISSFVEPKVKQTTPATKTKQPEKQSHNFNRIEIDSNAFTPMTNVVPTINPMNVPTNKVVAVPEEKPKFKGLSRRARQRITPAEFNDMEFGALQNKQERILYLALRGWSLKVEKRGDRLYHYATKYIKREKFRKYVGCIIEEM